MTSGEAGERDASRSPAQDRGRTGAIARWLDAIERAGNRFPEPIVVFLGLAVLVVLASFVGARRHLSAEIPSTGGNVAVVNLLSADGFRRLVKVCSGSFPSLMRLGSIVPVLLGLGVAERTGLLRVALVRVGRAVPGWALTAVLVFVAVHAGFAGNTGTVLLPPIGALLFLAAGRHPIAGLAAAFAGVTAGYGAGWLWTSLDVSLAAATSDAAGAGHSVHPAATTYFTGAASIVLTVAGVLVNRRWVEPRLGAYSPPDGADDGSPTSARGQARTAEDETRALRLAGVALLAIVLVLAALVVPEKGLLRDDSGTSRPFFDALPLIAMGTLLVPAAVFGHFAGSTPDHRAFVRTAGKAASDLGPFLVIAFVAAQLVAVLDASDLAVVLAIKASRAVRHAHLGGVPLAVGVACLAAAMGLVVPSASARWNVMAAAIVPLFVASGWSPESAQAAFRAGMSPGLVLTPMVPFYAVFAAYVKRFDRRSGTGTLAAVTLPYSIAFGIAWTVLLAVWLGAGLPLGPAGGVAP